ncbi:lysosomal alpha-mannosidase-like [Littorina saxatilis]|uniref:lysosomal alpha-mannosidase-like n=1 Tax=Littorina saxatilis TaxID=31220 RepID=UPI0038B6A27D
MRFSLRRTLLGLLVMVVLQLTVYYWVVAPDRRGRSPSLTRLTPLPRQDRDGPGTCDVKKCPEVKEGMINVHLIPHSHDDVGWLKTADQYFTGEYPKSKGGDIMYTEGMQCVRCVLSSTIRNLLLNPDRRFIFMEMAFLSRYWNEIDDRVRQQIKRLIESRQLEIVLGGWVMSDAAVTYYNDIIDQHTLGFDFIHKTFGPCAQSRVAWHVDQFGHSREHASIFSKMGYDGLFVGRVDFQDLAVRKKTKTLEFVWETSPNADDYSGNLFTQTTFDGYYAPRGFVLDGVENLFKGSRELENTLEFMNIVRERANAFRTNHLLLPMGSDFGYRVAGDWFKNMDKLIELVNAKQTEGKKKVIERERKINLLYSTPSCYLQHVHNSNLTWAVKTDDLHPYAIAPGAYWTGYFTSRSGQKLLVKHAGATLQACKQLGIFSRLKDSFDRTNVLRKAMAVMQHHDAITGTEKQHVSDDYNHMVSEGMLQCQSVISEAYNKMLETPEERRHYQFSFCPELNISSCPPTENGGKVVILVYNALSRPLNTWVRLPVTRQSVSVRGSKGEEVPSQLTAIPSGVSRLPRRSSESDTEVVFPAMLPAMGYTSFVLSTSQESAGGQIPMRTNTGKADIVMENKHLKVTFDGQTGRMKALENLSSKRSTKLSQDMAYYRAVQSGYRSSGAYVFIPEKELPHRVGGTDPVSVRYYQGELVQEIHQQFCPWVSQVVRLYKDSRHLEIQWTVGPIPTNDNQGKEVVSFFVSDLKSGGKFYTDSNGREVLERRLNHRETWNLTVVDAISGNYYPVTSRIFIQDVARDTQLTILPDRSQGGSSLYDGTLELMVHRRLLFDDALGVGEALNEQEGNDGITYTGKHYIFLDNIHNSAVLTREKALENHFSPTLTFLPLTSNSDSILTNMPKKSFLNKPLPNNVQVLTLDYTSDNHSTVYLLRLEHFYEKGESPILSTAATVKLQNLFSPFEVTEAEEVSLGGNFNPGTLKRHQWTTDNHHVNTPSIASSDYNELMESPFIVKLKPMEIRTFRVYVSGPSSSSLFFS